jgi:rRNA maturation endonuclease Nob1
MGLAALLGLYLLSAGWSPPALGGFVPQTPAQSPAVSSPDSSKQQSAEPTQPLPSPSGQTQKPAAQAKPTPSKPRHRKKTPLNCSSAPTALNTAVAKPADSANSTDSVANSAGPTNARSNNPGSKNADPSALKPCPPPKKVVRDGGSNEPKVQLTGGTTAQRASDKSSTEQLKAATEENLKKAEGRELSPTQREIVSQIKEFMEQSKAAVAAGDLERGHNLALKANLLSDELVKP